jgi:hypothetical protein
MEDSPPAFAVSAKKTPQSAVEDLERRLAMLGDAAAAPALFPEQQQYDMKPPAVAAPEAQAAAPVKGGKNALLVSPKEEKDGLETTVKLAVFHLISNSPFIHSLPAFLYPFIR